MDSGVLRASPLTVRGSGAGEAEGAMAGRNEVRQRGTQSGSAALDRRPQWGEMRCVSSIEGRGERRGGAGTSHSHSHSQAPFFDLFLTEMAHSGGERGSRDGGLFSGEGRGRRGEADRTARSHSQLLAFECDPIEQPASAAFLSPDLREDPSSSNTEEIGEFESLLEASL